MKRHVYIFFAVIATTATLLTACREENETDYEIKKGKTLVVRLDANPSTGYAWEWPASNSTEIVDLTYSDFETGDDDSIGGSCKQTLVFTGVKRGTAVVELVYKRAFSQEILDTHSFTIKVY